MLALIITKEDYDNIEEAVWDIADEIKFTNIIVLQVMILHLKLSTTWEVTGSFLQFV